jgi:hypothetical protein
VTQVGVAFSYGGTTVRGLARANFCGTNGDSGGPVYAQNTAYGLHVAGASYCDSYYQGIRPAQNLLNVDILLG